LVLLVAGEIQLPTYPRHFGRSNRCRTVTPTGANESRQLSNLFVAIPAIEVRIASVSHHEGRNSHSIVRSPFLLIVALKRMFCPSCGSSRSNAAVRSGST
jgi:hypothetical protein